MKKIVFKRCAKLAIKFYEQSAGNQIFGNLKFQNFPRDHAPGPF